MKLWLDDCRPAPEGWDWHLHVDTMIDDIQRLFVKGVKIEMISLDNDLGEYEKEGYKVLDWLESLQVPITFGIHIHSANPVARERMRAIIQRNGWKEIRQMTFFIPLFLFWNVLGGLLGMVPMVCHAGPKGAIAQSEGLEFVNPVFVYKHNRVNWFGAIIVAFAYGLVCPIATLIYWFYKLCTVGRK